MRAHPGLRAPRKSAHWAFVAPVRPAVPQVTRSDWVRNPIDAFILSRLEREGMAPSPEAERATLLRRVSLDLTGLPPTPAELDAFLADRSAGRVREAGGPPAGLAALRRALGARSGWMPPATPIPTATKRTRRASSGSIATGSSTRSTATCRTTSFVIEQIAGDLLPGATQDQRVATGFLRNSMINEEGGVDPEQFRMEAMFDRMDAIGKGILGVTIQCAQCHDHKYDPLKQEEYYRMFAFLNDTYEANIAVYTPEQERQRAEIYRQAPRRWKPELRRRTPDWPQRMAAWEARVKERPARLAGAAARGGRYLDRRRTRTADEGRFDAGAGVCAHQAYRRVHGEIGLAGDSRGAFGTADGSRICPMAGRGGRSAAAGALTEFRMEAAPGGDSGEVREAEIWRAPPRISTCRRRRWSRSSTIRAASGG